MADLACGRRRSLMLLQSLLQGTPHRHAFAIGGEHDDFLLGIRVEPCLGFVEALGMHSHVASHDFSRSHRRLHAQQLAQRADPFGEGFLDADPQHPIFQDIRLLPRRQPQPRVHRRPGDLLLRARSVHIAFDGKHAEDRAVEFGPFLLAAPRGLPFVFDGLAMIAIASSGSKGLKQPRIRLQRLVEQRPLDLVDAKLHRLDGLLHQCDHVLKHGFRLANRFHLRDHDMDLRGWVSDFSLPLILLRRSLLFMLALAAEYIAA